jgi:hypothetical protein
MASSSKKWFRCAVCAEEYDDAVSIGRWECRTHVVRERAMDGNASAYPCCSLRLTDDRAAYETFHGYMTPALLRGCVAADHTPVLNPDVPRAPRNPKALSRPLDDLHIVCDINEMSQEFKDIPNAAYIIGPTMFQLGQVRRGESKGLLSVTFNVPEADGSTRNVQKDLTAIVIAAIERVFDRDAFFENDAARKRERDRLLDQRHTWKPVPGVRRTPEMDAFIARQHMMSDHEFIRCWYTDMKPDDVQVRISVVRAVAPTQDPLFITALQQQRAFVIACNQRDQ